jgi:hypothetical protein
MLFHKVKYFHAKKGNIMKKGAQHFHNKRFMHFKNEFHTAVQVSLTKTPFLIKGTEIEAKGRQIFRINGGLVQTGREEPILGGYY